MAPEVGIELSVAMGRDCMGENLAFASLVWLAPPQTQQCRRHTASSNPTLPHLAVVAYHVAEPRRWARALLQRHSPYVSHRLVVGIAGASVVRGVDRLVKHGVSHLLSSDEHGGAEGSCPRGRKTTAGARTQASRRGAGKRGANIARQAAQGRLADATRFEPRPRVLVRTGGCNRAAAHNNLFLVVDACRAMKGWDATR